MNADTLFSVGDMATRLSQPVHRITYVIRSRNIQPVGKAGGVRVFDDSALAQVEHALRRMDCEKEVSL